MNRRELLVATPAVREVSPFAVDWGRQTRALSFQEREKKLRRPDAVILEKLSPSGVVCFSSWKSLFSGHQLGHRSRQALMLPLDMICYSKSQEFFCFWFLVWWYKGLLTVLNRALSRRVERGLSRDVFSSRWNPQAAECGVWGLHLPGVHYEKIALLKHAYFCDTHFKILTRILTHNLMPGHIRILRIWYNL